MSDEYNKKRNFDRTPEPKGDLKPAENDVLHFVVQMHQSSHLHYDFRLELNGALLSWAVPKGPSLDPKEKRLAMKVEDHPYDYKDFEGVIPAGNYGAGTVMIWDEGTYRPIAGRNKKEQEKILNQQLHAEHITFILDGSKLKGEFALVKLKNAKEKNAWLLVKSSKDRYAKPVNISELNQSARSGRNLEEIRREISQTGDFWTSRTKEIDIDAPAREITTPVVPMLATLVSDPFDNKDWLFEIKWDGYRMITEIGPSGVNAYSRNQKPFNQKFPSIISSLKSFRKEAIFDGEVVALDHQGRSRLELLQNNLLGQGASASIFYFIFDLLHYEGKDLTQLPLTKRKEILRQVLPKVPNIKYSEEIISDGKDFFAAAKTKDLEGIMAKKSDSTYQPGKRSKDWLKIKIHKQQEVVIGGFTAPKGSRQGLGSLLMGVNDGRKFSYIGNVGTGFDDEKIRNLLNIFQNIIRKTPPFDNPPKRKDITWLEPRLVAEVKFQEWTSAGSMRQPVFLGLREDKDPTTVVKEVPSV